MSTTARGKKYYTSFMVKGKRFASTFDSREAGEAWEAETKRDLKEGRAAPVAPTAVTPGGGSLATLRRLHRVVHRDRWSQCASGDKLSRNAMFFVEWFGPERHPREVTEEEIYNWVDTLFAQGNSAATVNRKVSAVKVLLKTAQRRRVIDHIPHVEKYKERSIGAASVFFDFGDEAPVLDRLHHMGCPRQAAAVMFLIDTGCRLGELLGLRYENIRGSVASFMHTKNGDWRSVPLSKRAQLSIQLCEREGKDADKPFGDLTAQQLRDTLKEVYEKLGGKYASLEQPIHIFRHSCASRLATRGVDANRIKEWMGHSSLLVTQRYMKLAPSSLDQAVAALEPESPALKIVGKD